ncbi:MAG: DUF2141 domain-containing protein [Pseudomonadota bacterium]
MMSTMCRLAAVPAILLATAQGADAWQALTAISFPVAQTVEGDRFAAYCETGAGAPAVRLHIAGMRDGKGQLRVQLYGDAPESFLEKGARLIRIQVPTPPEGETARLCVPLTVPGTYALFVLHDRDMNGKAGIFSEGFGFSNNPQLKLRKPRHDEVAFTVGQEVLDMNIEMQYFGGERRRSHGR